MKRIISLILVVIVLFNGILPALEKDTYAATRTITIDEQYYDLTEEEKNEVLHGVTTQTVSELIKQIEFVPSKYGDKMGIFFPSSINGIAITKGDEYDDLIYIGGNPYKIQFDALNSENPSDNSIIAEINNYYYDESEYEGEHSSVGFTLFSRENQTSLMDFSNSQYKFSIVAMDPNNPSNQLDDYISFSVSPNSGNSEDSEKSSEEGATVSEPTFENFNSRENSVVPTVPVTQVEINEPESDPAQNGLGKNTATPLEMTLSEIGLNIGDFILEYLTFLVKEEVTIEKIIFNRVDSLNANFFDKVSNPSTAPATKYVRDAINYWYDFLGKIVIVLYLMALVVIGIMIMLDNPQKKVQAKDLLKKWTLGIAIFYFFPYAIRYGFEINNTLVSLVENQFGGSTVDLGAYIGSVSDLRYDDIEYRSPEYVTASTYLLKLGSEEATNAYINRLEDYQRKGDTMRIMRSLAGISGRFIYVILWYIMLWQLLIFLYIYYKRYLMIAFLIAIFPITLIQYIVGNIAEGKQSAISSWCKEFFTNLFVQSIHAVIYGIISGVIINQVVAAVRNGNPYNINWFLMLCATNFMFAGEKILREIMNAGMTASTQAAGDVSKGARGRMKAGRGRLAKAINQFRKL